MITDVNLFKAKISTQKMHLKSLELLTNSQIGFKQLAKIPQSLEEKDQQANNQFTKLHRTLNKIKNNKIS
jgi:hypothetical protein